MRLISTIPAALTSVASLWAGTSAAAPPIRCDLGSAAWCMAQFDGSMRMHDTPDNRVWELYSRGAADQRPMVLTESKACSSESKPEPALVENSRLVAEGGNVVRRFRYRLNGGGCTLSFELPESSVYATYKQFMLYGILIGPDKRTQLYKIGGK